MPRRSRCTSEPCTSWSRHTDLSTPGGLSAERSRQLYSEQGKYAEAESLYQRALRIREQALGLQHPLTQKTAKNYCIPAVHTGTRN